MRSVVGANDLDLAMDPERISRELRDSLARWGRLWGVPQLDSRVSVRTSSRFQRSLGSYRTRRAEITLAEWLVEGSAQILEEVLCHEAAHAAVHLLHGDGVRPHGLEWRRLMARAEMPARLRIPASCLPASQRSLSSQSRMWEHRCPVCQATRFAKTRVVRWRCRTCREAGLAGNLLIERIPSAVAVDG
jgi:predicted SprT family Zn-dependent metalloprotease